MDKCVQTWTKAIRDVPLHLNITLGIPTALLEKKKAEIRQRKEEKEKIEQKLKEKDIPQDPSISTTTENTEKNQE